EIEHAHAGSKSRIGHEPVIQKRHLLVEESIPLLPASGNAVPILPLAFDHLLRCLTHHLFPSAGYLIVCNVSRSSFNSVLKRSRCRSRCGWSALNFQSRLKMAVNSFLCVTAKS